MNCLIGTYFVYTSLSMFAYVCESEQLVYMYVCVCKCERHWHDIYWSCYPSSANWFKNMAINHTP